MVIPSFGCRNDSPFALQNGWKPRNRSPRSCSTVRTLGLFFKGTSTQTLNWHWTNRNGSKPTLWGGCCLWKLVFFSINARCLATTQSEWSKPISLCCPSWCSETKISLTHFLWQQRTQECPCSLKWCCLGILHSASSKTTSFQVFSPCKFSAKFTQTLRWHRRNCTTEISVCVADLARHFLPRSFQSIVHAMISRMTLLVCQGFGLLFKFAWRCSFLQGALGCKLRAALQFTGEHSVS